jgi:hypothetical protein
MFVFLEGSQAGRLEARKLVAFVPGQMIFASLRLAERPMRVIPAIGTAGAGTYVCVELVPRMEIPAYVAPRLGNENGNPANV